MELRIIFRPSPRCPHHGPFSSQKQWNPPVLIFTAMDLLLNNTLFTNSMQQISALTVWIEFSNYCNWMLTWTKYIDLGPIPKCDCHQFFILLLWYFKPEASLNYVANWSLFLCYVLFWFLSDEFETHSFKWFFYCGILGTVKK